MIIRSIFLTLNDDKKIDPNLPQFDGHLKIGTMKPKGVSDEKEESI